MSDQPAREPWPSEPIVIEHSGLCDAGNIRWAVINASHRVYKRAVHPPCTCGAGLLALFGVVEVYE